MLRIEWDDGFQGICHTKWTDDMDFIKGMYESLVSNGHSDVKIIKRTDVTEEFLGKIK